MSRLHDVASARGSVILRLSVSVCEVFELISSAECEQLFATCCRAEARTLVGDTLHETGSMSACLGPKVRRKRLTIVCHWSCRRTLSPGCCQLPGVVSAVRPPTLMTIGSTAACTPASNAVAAISPRIMVECSKKASKMCSRCWQELGVEAPRF